VLRARYESPFDLDLGLTHAIAKAPEIVSRWIAAIVDVFDLPDRIIDKRGERREKRQRRRLREAELSAALRDFEEFEERRRELRRREMEIAEMEQHQRWIVTNAERLAIQRAVGEALHNPEAAKGNLRRALEDHRATYAFDNTARRLREHPLQIEQAEVFEWIDVPPPEEPEPAS
jgi:hypothetical protein